MKYKNYKMKEIASFSQGKQVEVNEQYAEKSENKERFIRIVDYTNENEPIRYVKNFGERYYAKKNDLVMIRYGSQTAGKVVMGKEGIIANNMFKINLNNEIILNKYMYYYLSQKEVYKYIRNSQSSSTMPALNFGILNDFEIKIPNIEEQKRTVKILSLIDKKIDENNHTNNNLYDMLKIEFRNKFYTLNDNLFRLIDLIYETLGGDWGKEKSEGNNNTKVFCIRGADIPSMEFSNKGKAPIRYILEKNYDKKKLTQDSIIIEISGGSPTQSTGRTAYITGNIIQSYENPIICTNFCRAIKLKQKEYAPFLYMTLKLMYEDKLFFNWENGTTGIKNLALSDMLENLEVGIPNDEELNKYNIMFNSIMNKISSNSNENETLIKLRDTLLPKLINGEIDLENIKV